MGKSMEEHQGIHKHGGMAAADGNEMSPVNNHAYEITLQKTEKGFGLYFARDVHPDGSEMLVVDGFQDDDLQRHLEEAMMHIQIGDILVGINETDCSEMEVIEIVELLRAASVDHPSVLRFHRRMEVSKQMDEDAMDTNDHESMDRKDASSSTLTESLFGAIRKVKSKIKAEMDLDEEALRREDEEDRLYEQQWLEQFDLLRQEFRVKWDTCTYTADDFCGLLLHSSDADRKQYLLQEYPVLMGPWNEPGGKASQGKNISWPAVHMRHDMVSQSFETSAMSAKPCAQRIACCAQLERVLISLRRKFLWRREHVERFSIHLEQMGVYSCADLRAAIEELRYFQYDNRIQSLAFPRITRVVRDHLYKLAMEEENDCESLAFANMEKLMPKNPPSQAA